MDALRKVSLEWPVAAHKARELEKALAEAEGARGPLGEELLAAQRAEETRGLRDKLARVLKREAQVDQARGKLAGCPVWTRPLLRKSVVHRHSLKSCRPDRGGQACRDRCRQGGCGAGRAGGLDPEGRRRLGPGETARFGGRKGAHRASRHGDRSEVGRRGLDERAEKAGGRPGALIGGAARASWGVRDRRGGNAQPRIRSCDAEADAAAKNLAEELAGESLADIKTHVAALGPAAVTRPLATIASALATLKAQSDARASELAEMRRRMQDWASDLRDAGKAPRQAGEAKSRE